MQTEFLQTIGEGWAYPLNRFMNEMELLECLQMKTLTVNGERHLMSVPITQHCTKEFKEANEKASSIVLTWKDDVVAIINKPVFFENRKEEICTRTFGCFESTHPMAENICNQGEFLISGASMDFVKKIMWNDEMDSYRMTPREINNEMIKRNADAVFAFQVRNPLHNGHCLLLK
jgi:3'-phosphoadenosine 5'-phosphosulfate synthase